MSWHYLQVQEEASWEENSLDGAPDALLRLIPTHDRYCSPDSETDTWKRSRSGTTSAHSTAAHGEEQLTLFPGDSPVRTSVQQVSVKDLPAKVQAFGLKCSESLGRFSLVLCSRKTRRTCVPMALAPSSKDLPAWGMTADGACWEFGTRAARTDATGCGFLPTPTAAGNKFCPSMQRLPKHRKLLEFVGEYLPTPTAKLYHSNKGGAAGRVGKTRYSLETIIGGTWIAFREWMMGWPIGWTEPEPLETDRFQSWLQWHGRFFQEGDS